MGYKGNIYNQFGFPLDVSEDLKNAVGKNIELSFFSDIPEGEKKYILKDVDFGLEVRGMYILFKLDDNGKELEFLISGIKNFEYDIHPTFRKYWVSSSDELLFEMEEGATSMQSQYGEKTNRFILFIE